jgi:hypothetical protein
MSKKTKSFRFSKAFSIGASDVLKKSSFMGTIEQEMTPFIIFEWCVYEFGIKYGSNNGLIAGYFLLEQKTETPVPAVLIRTEEYMNLLELKQAMQNLAKQLPQLIKEIKND